MTTQSQEVEMIEFECLICHTTMKVRAQGITSAPWCHITPMLAKGAK